MAALPQPKLYTPDEYLALERNADYKSEYYNGQIYAMAGASEPHNRINYNLSGLLFMQMRGRSCFPYASDMRLKVSDTGLYAYPDQMALCGEPQFEDGYGDTLLNPQVLIEVLSPSTEAYDRGDKFALYRRIPSLTDYVLVSQDKVRVEHFVRQGEQWLLTEISDPDGTLVLAPLDVTLTLSDIYDKVEFAGEEPADDHPSDR